MDFRVFLKIGSQKGLKLQKFKNMNHERTLMQG